MRLHGSLAFNPTQVFGVCHGEPSIVPILKSNQALCPLNREHRA